MLLEYPKKVFKDKLMKIGVIAEFLTSDMLDFYRLSNVIAYEVKEGFPLLDVSSLPSAVFNVEYSLALDECNKWMISMNQLFEEIEVQ